VNAYGLEIEVYSVSQISDRVARLLQADAVLADVWVSGEISNFTHHSSGHMYMTLKDDASRLRAVMFQGANRGLRFRPESGMRVFAHGYVGVYRSGGEYQLYIDFMEPAGLGGLFLAFQQLKARLEAEGLFDPALKRSLPRFPKRIAVATASTLATTNRPRKLRSIEDGSAPEKPWSIIWPTAQGRVNVAADESARKASQPTASRRYGRR